jgi:hypothetical protein
MFSWFRKRQEASVQDLHQLAATAAMQTQDFVVQVEASLRGLPLTLLDDPFFIGLITMHAAIAVRKMTNGQAAMHAVERTMIKSIEIVFGRYSCTSQDAIRKLLEFKNHPEYTKGVRAADLIQSANAGRTDIANEPEVLAARERVEGLPSPFKEVFGKTPSERLAYQLTVNLVLDPLKSKYAAVSHDDT